MRMPNTLSISVTAEIADLQAKFAVAQASVRSLNSEMMALARQSAKGMLDPAGSAQLKEGAGQLLTARAQAEGFAGQAAAAGVTLQGVSRAASESGIHIGGAAREFRALSSDLARGDYARLPIVFGMLARSLAGVGAAGMLAVVGVGAIAAGLAYLAIRAIGASHALDEMQIAAAAAGNNLPRSQLKEFTDNLSEAGNVTAKAAQEIVRELANIPGMTAPSLASATALVSRFAITTHQDAEEAGKSLVKIFKAPSAGDALTQLEHLGYAIDLNARNEAAAADSSNNVNKQKAAIIDLVNEASSRGAAIADKEAASFQASWSNKLQLGAAWLGETALVITQTDRIAAALGLENPVIATQNRLIEEQNALRAKQNAVLASKPKEVADTPLTQKQEIEVGIKYVEKGKPLSAQIREATVEIQGLVTAAAAAQARLNDLRISNVNPEIIKAAANDLADMNSQLQEQRQRLDEIKYGPVMQRARTEMEQTAATSSGTQTQILEQQVAVVDKYLSKVRQGSAQYTELQSEAARMDLEIKRSTSSELIADARRINTEISGDETRSSVQRLAAERDTLQELLSDTRITGQQRVEVEQEVAAKSTELAKTAASEQQAITRSNVESQIAISKTQIESEKSTLDSELQLHQITASQKYQLLADLTRQEAALHIDRLNNELASLQPLTAKYAEVYNQILELKAKLNADLAALDRQQVADAAHAAQQQVTAWRQATDEIEGAEQTMLGDLLSRRKSFGQAAYQVAGQLVDKEIEDDVRAMTTRLLIQDQGLAQQKALEQGGVLYHAVAQQEQTQATKIGLTQQQGAEESNAIEARTADQSDLVATQIDQSAEAQIVNSAQMQQAASVVRSQQAQSAAVQAGGQVRVTATQTAAIQSKTAQNEVNGPTVMADAAKAFSGTYASVSSIPIIGWILAPVAAAAAFAVVAGYEGLATLEQGAWELPRDVTANLHAGERVMPRPFAEEYRSRVSGEGGGGDTYGDFNQTNHIHQVQPTAGAIIAQLRKATRNFHPATMSR